MTLEEFRKLVRAEFGPDLHRMTPANVREFLDRVQAEAARSETIDGKFRINEPERTYEGIVRDFFLRVLEMPADQAVIRLWLHALEMTVDSLADIEAEKFERLFAGLSADGVD